MLLRLQPLQPPLLPLLVRLEGGAGHAQLRPDAREAVAALEAVRRHLPHQLVEDHLVPPHDAPHLRRVRCPSSSSHLELSEEIGGAPALQQLQHAALAALLRPVAAAAAAAAAALRHRALALRLAPLRAAPLLSQRTEPSTAVGLRALATTRRHAGAPRVQPRRLVDRV